MHGSGFKKPSTKIMKIMTPVVYRGFRLSDGRNCHIVIVIEYFLYQQQGGGNLNAIHGPYRGFRP